MEANSASGRIGGKWSGNPFSGRRGGIFVAIAAALLAGVLFYAVIKHYKSSSPTPVAANTSVIVATKYIAHDTPVSMAEVAGAFQRTTLKPTAVLPNAITDPSQIAGEVATTNIAPGQELVASDFATGTVGIQQYLTGYQRALEIPEDATHGLAGYVQAGDYVDLFQSTGPKVTLLAKDILILGVGNPGGAGPDLVLQVPTDSAGLAIANAADNGRIWIVARPPGLSSKLKTPTGTG